MSFLISHLILLDGWRRLILAFACGAVASFAQAPFGLLPLTWVSFPIFVWLLDGAFLGRSRAQALASFARVGWCFGFGFFLFTFYWLGSAFLVEADKFAWALPLGVIALPAGLALFWAAATGLAAKVWSASPLRVVWLALALAAGEWLRGIIFTGLPWGGLGQALASNGLTMQALALVGPDMYNLIAPIVFAIPVFLFYCDADPILSKRLGTLSVALLAAQLGYGAYRLQAETLLQQHEIVVRLVQPNIPQKEKWKLENRSWIFNRLLALSSLDQESQPLDQVDLVIWPESAIPFYLMEQPAGLAAIANILPQRSVLLTGALRREANLSGDETVLNSIYQMAGDGTIMATYDKVHLVPFGEYLPKRKWLEALGLEQLTAQKTGFSSGSKRKLLGDEKIGRILPLICYEVAFSSELLAYPQSSDMIVNVTNDAWFGTTIGPYQHLHLARMRAIETGLPLLRVANTGISAVIDSKGQVTHSLGLEEDGIVQTLLPAKMPATVYSQLGSWIFYVSWLLLCPLVASIGRKNVSNDCKN